MNHYRWVSTDGCVWIGTTYDPVVFDQPIPYEIEAWEDYEAIADAMWAEEIGLDKQTEKV